MSLDSRVQAACAGRTLAPLCLRLHNPADQRALNLRQLQLQSPQHPVTSGLSGAHFQPHRHGNRRLRAKNRKETTTLALAGIAVLCLVHRGTSAKDFCKIRPAPCTLCLSLTLDADLRRYLLPGIYVPGAPRP
ncbi:hypothetical protein NDU88_008110 [Pleurodeles waltl]|uniref:Uncharacterized protein n=1 Tax=Pleurodeles waltl TaxID=8319 RepID=A0AAV7PR73_PLEWA|nr:hypothetical protein NDU88_008110 [Pleurodeles waltl]